MITTTDPPCNQCQGQADELETLRTETVELRRRLAATEFDPAKYAAKVFVIKNKFANEFLGQGDPIITGKLGKALKRSVRGEAQALVELIFPGGDWHVYQPTAQEILAVETEAAAEWEREKGQLA